MFIINKDKSHTTVLKQPAQIKTGRRIEKSYANFGISILSSFRSAFMIHKMPQFFALLLLSVGGGAMAASNIDSCKKEDYDCWSARATEYVNDVRRRHGARATLMDGSVGMLSNAVKHSKIMAARKELFHQDLVAISGEFGCGLSCESENVATFSAGADDKLDLALRCVQLWEESEGHLRNIMQAAEVVVSAIARVGDAVWCTQTFAQKAVPTSASECNMVGNKQKQRPQKSKKALQGERKSLDAVKESKADGSAAAKGTELPIVHGELEGAAASKEKNRSDHLPVETEPIPVVNEPISAKPEATELPVAQGAYMGDEVAAALVKASIQHGNSTVQTIKNEDSSEDMTENVQKCYRLCVEA